MPAYAIGLIKVAHMNHAIRSYLERIDATLAPYRGRVLIHGGPYRPLEGDLDGDLVVIEFDSIELAARWYASPAYRAIKQLRTGHSVGTVFLVEGVEREHKATDMLG